MFNRAVRLTLLAGITLGLLGLGGWLVLRPKPPAEVLHEGMVRYGKALQELKDKKGSAALLHFQEAKITAENALKRVEEEARGAKGATAAQRDQWTELSGKALYLKSQALRDEAFAKGLVDGKPLDETLDTSTGKNFRSFAVIPDPKLREDAIVSLRTAATRLPKDEELQVEALRVELVLRPVSWRYAHQFAKALLEKKPDDTRAHYVMARFEFEQPLLVGNAASGPPTALDKRSRTRANDALTHLDKVKAAKDYPVGRTAFLEAQMRKWLAKDAETRGDTARVEKENDLLNKLLFDPATGALAKAQSPDGAKNLSVWDLEGFLGTYLIALDLLTVEQKKTGTAQEKLASTLAATLAYCQRVEQEQMGSVTTDLLAGTMLAALGRTQAALAKENGKEWKQALDTMRAFLGKTAGKEPMAPHYVAELVTLLQREAVLASKAGDGNRAEALRKESMSRIKDALAQCEKNKTPVQQALPLHALAAEMLFAAGGSNREIESQLKPLFDSKDAKMQGIAHLVRGALFEREGRLEKAREDLEAALKSHNADVELRANMALATNVYMGLGQPGRALVSFQALDRIYERLDELTPQERAWVQQFLRSPESLAVVHASANLEAARQDMVAFLRDTPTKPIPPALFQRNEKVVEEILKKLPARSSFALQVRADLITYYAATNRVRQAEKELALAFAEFPDSSALLQLEIGLALRKALEEAGGKFSKDDEKKVTAKLDTRMQEFTKRFPTDRAARLFWVNWLAGTGRNDEALAYLKDPLNFPGAKDDAYNRVLAQVLARSGDKQESTKLLQQLPQDPLVDALLIQMGTSNEAKQKSIQEAMSRHVSNGVFRIWNGELALSEKRYADAARAFFNALDFTRVRRLAENGLQRSLLELAGAQPKEAKKLTEEMLRDYPDEPALLLAYAVTALNLDDIGQPNDGWDEQNKSMAGALNAWEKAVVRNNPNRLAVGLARADLWIRANQPEVARTEVLRALKQAPDDQAVILLAIRLDLLFGTKDHLADARNHLLRLKKINPEGAATLIVEARIEDAEKHSDKAAAILAALVEKKPQEADAYALLVQFSNRQKETAKALKWSQTWADKMRASVPAATNLVVQLSRDKKLAEAQKFADAFVAARVKEYGQRLEERKAPDKAPEKTRQALLDDLRFDLEFRFAIAFMQGEQDKEGEARLDKLLKQKPESVPVLMAIGEIHLQRKAWAKCVSLYEKVLAREKDYFVAGNNLAWVLATQQNEPQKALEVLRSVSKGRFSGKMLPGDRLHPEVLDTLGTVYQKFTGADPELHKEMIGVFEAASKRYPRDARMYYYLGLAYARSKDNVRAAQYLQSALALARDTDNVTMTAAQRSQVISEAEAVSKRLQPDKK